MKVLVLIFGLAMHGAWTHAQETNCNGALDESSPNAEYVVYYDLHKANSREEITDDFEKKYAAEYQAFESKDLLPFLKRQFPAAADRIRLLSYPNENIVVVVFPEDRTPVIAAMKTLERVNLRAASEVTVRPKNADFFEPERILVDEPSEFPDFMVIYQSSLQHQDGNEAFEQLNAEFIARDLKPWLAQAFPDVADQIKFTGFAQINSVNVRFPKNAIPSLKRVKELETNLLQTVSSLEVFNGP